MNLGNAVGEAVNWARSLAIEPANLMTPTHIAAQATDLAKSAGMQVEVIEEEQAREMGMNSYLSVAQWQRRGREVHCAALSGPGRRRL